MTRISHTHTDSDTAIVAADGFDDSHSFPSDHRGQMRQAVAEIIAADFQNRERAREADVALGTAFDFGSGVE